LAIIILGLGFLVYTMRRELMVVLVAPGKPHLQDNLNGAMADLVKTTHANLVVIAEVDMASNYQRLKLAQFDGKPWDRAPAQLPAVSDVSNARVVSSFMLGHPSCLDFRAFSELVKRMLDHGEVERLCVIPIRDGERAPIAVIYLGWRQPLDDRSEKIVLELARSVGDSLVH